MFTREQVLKKFFEMSTQSWRCRKKRGKKKNTHTQTKDVVYEKKKDDFPVTQYSILCFGLQTKFTILEQQITITYCNLLLRQSELSLETKKTVLNVV